MENITERRLLEYERAGALSAAYTLKMLLQSKKLNLVTIESLTAGMIASTLTDVPGAGPTLYGGFVVYDTDAKRTFTAVSTEGVYSEKTAKQMATGALRNSRAMVALSVTGHAMPFPAERERIGEVDIGVALRTDPQYVQTMRFEACSGKGKNACDGWKKLNDGGYAPFQYTAHMADFVRIATVRRALEFCIEVVKANTLGYKNLPSAEWDIACQPSWIIKDYLAPGSTVATADCDGWSQNDITQMSSSKLKFGRRGKSRTARCMAKTVAGTRCKNKAIGSCRRCRIHLKQ
jgi:nicotinamide-nucleotide amidase